MKKRFITLLSIPILMTMLVLGINTKASAGGIKDVVIIGCGADFVDPFPFPGEPPPPPPGYSVNYSSSSAGAPTVPIDFNCAQAIADVLNAGFKLQRVKGTQSDDLNYIFIKK